MSDDRFKFISPGVFIEEIDQSQLPELTERMGPVVVGRFRKGPSNRPVKIKDFNELVDVFGAPAPGNASGDIWRSAAMTAPTYAAYAAQAWLRNNTPCTIIRLLGVSHEDADSYSTSPTAPAGWRTANTIAKTGSVGGAYGLLVMPDPDATNQGATTGSLVTTIKIQQDLQAGHWIKIGIPNHLHVGGVGATPNEAQSLQFLFAANSDAPGDQTSIKILAGTGTGEANTTEAMNRLVALINGSTAEGAGQQAALDALENGAYGVHAAGTTGVASLAAIQASLTASYTATNVGAEDNAVGTLTISTVQGGNLPNNIRIMVRDSLIGGADGVATLGVATVDSENHAEMELTSSTAVPVTGALGAIWYVEDGYVQLMGTPRDALDSDNVPVTSSGVWIRSTGGQSFHARVASGSAGTVLQGAKFNFDPTSDQFIRKSFNTDPTATNSDLIDTSAGGAVQKYFLGETFEEEIRTRLSANSVSASAAGDYLACVVGLSRPTPSTDWSNHLVSATAGGTGWFFSQDKRGAVESGNGFDPTDTSMVEKLFRFVALDNGEMTNREIKISLADIKQPANNFVKFGSFTVLIRDAKDTDNNPVVLERYTGVNLDPTSSKYIGRVIGDKEYAYDTVSRTVRQYGTYDNASKFVRVLVSAFVDAGNAEGLLPFGVYGPVVPDTLEVLGNQGHTDADPKINNLTLATPADIKGAGSWVVGADSLPTASLQNIDALVNTAASPIDGDGSDNVVWDAGRADLTGAIEWPSNRIRVSASEGDLTRLSQAYFGYQSNRAGTRIFAEENLDHFRGPALGVDMFSQTVSASHYSWIFTLDDLVVVNSADGLSVKSAVHTSGSRASATSKTGLSGSDSILDAGFNRFTSPVFGGQDGLDVTEKDPFRNRYLSTGSSATTNYAWNTIERSINVLSDPEFIEFDIATIPGLTNQTLTDQLVVAVEERADALAIIDLSGSYEPPHEGIVAGEAVSRRTGSVDNVVANLKGRGLNSSYACAFFPFVQIRDTVSDAILFVPPSVVALGTMSSSQRRSAVWFAPAGFTRGGLSEGSAGLPVVGVRTRVTSDQRDKLYDANINPIASFPAEGIVVFGQKTLQVTPSALDRINVRRLLIFLKKEISRIASRTLFEQNVQSTWDRFKGEVNPFLAGVKAGLGLTDYKLVLDSTTTTDELVDRNILYAKIFIKPARAIEFIALDFIITRSGASFDD